jgi:hypothetical protein
MLTQLEENLLLSVMDWLSALVYSNKGCTTYVRGRTGMSTKTDFSGVMTVGGSSSATVILRASNRPDKRTPCACIAIAGRRAMPCNQKACPALDKGRAKEKQMVLVCIRENSYF